MFMAQGQQKTDHNRGSGQGGRIKNTGDGRSRWQGLGFNDVNLRETEGWGRKLKYIVPDEFY